MRILKDGDRIGEPLEADLLADLENCIGRHEAAAAAKAIASDDGWAYLIKDTNDWLRWHFGIRRWSAAQFEAASAMLAERHKRIAELGARYIKFIIPEKSIVYPQFLPGVLRHVPAYPHRPAPLLHRVADNQVFYLADVLAQASKLGLVYFRGDSHPNWLGAYLIYRAIHETLAAQMAIPPAQAMPETAIKVARWGGDLYGQLAPELLQDLPEMFRIAKPDTGSELTLSVGIDPQTRRSHPVEVPQLYKDWFKSRESFTWENPDKSLPRCVIFRDSTALNFVDFLAENFSRTVAVWFGGRIVDEVIRREQPDVVIHIQAERLMSNMDAATPLFRVTAPRKSAWPTLAPLASGAA
jgi:hypothetical protein